MWFTRKLNRFVILKGRSHRVRSIEVFGDLDKVKQLHASGARILFVANHPSHSDPQMMIEVQRRLKVQSFFMAAYDVFLRSEWKARLMQKMGCFSIDREGNDRKAMSAAIDVLKKGDYALTIFPEGNVYLMNDRVTPFLDGTSFIAVKAHQALKGEGEVWIVPVSFKFTQVGPVSEKVWIRLKRLAEDSGFSGVLDPSDRVETVVQIGGHLLTMFLKEKNGIDSAHDFSDIAPEELRDRLLDIVTGLTGDLEDDLEIERNEGLFIVDRVRKIRSKIHQIRIDENTEETGGEDCISKRADRAILCFRILAYVLPYFKEHPSVDRYAETVERLCEDYYFRDFPPYGPRKAMVKVGTPISVGKKLNSSGGKAREVIPALTREIEETIQSGIDSLNKENDAHGASLITNQG